MPPKISKRVVEFFTKGKCVLINAVTLLDEGTLYGNDLVSV